MLRKALLMGGGAGLLATLLSLTVGVRLGLITTYLVRPDTHWFWYFSRAAGVTAYLALALATVWGLLLSTATADSIVARSRSVEAHRWLSAVSLALGAAHGLALVGDRYVQFDLLDVLLPFLAPYRPAAVGLGIVGLYLAVAVHGSFWLRARLGTRWWRALHVLSLPAFALVTLHGMLAGTDGGTAGLRSVYVVASGLVLWLTIFRVLTVRNSGRQRSAASRPAPLLQPADRLARLTVGRAGCSPASPSCRTVE